MGANITEIHEKFHAIAGPVPALYALMEALMEAKGGPIEIDIRIHGAIDKVFMAEVENPAELLELLRLTLGKCDDDGSE
jgi:hypothetical protein